MLGVVCNEKSTNVETLKYSSDNWALAQYHTDTEDQVIFVKKWRSAKGENLYAVAIVDLEKTDITQRSPTIWAIPVGNIFSLLPDYRYSDHRSFPYLTPSSQRDDARNFPVLVDESPFLHMLSDLFQPNKPIFLQCHRRRRNRKRRDKKNRKISTK
ncbi:MAG: hypothetical protein H6861_10275 [Rhodospirillales bacterium]|nr:hypothetical protein [Rhodospirillales bacterium]